MRLSLKKVGRAAPCKPPRRKTHTHTHAHRTSSSKPTAKQLAVRRRFAAAAKRGKVTKASMRG